MTATNGTSVRNHGRFRCFPRAASGTVLAVLVLGSPALAGCGGLPEELRVQRVAYCQGHSSDRPDNGFIDVEFRQGSTVVGSGSMATGVVLAAEVPVGDIQIYADGDLVGEVNENVATDGPYRSPAPDEVTYVHSGEGCPDTASM